MASVLVIVRKIRIKGVQHHEICVAHSGMTASNGLDPSSS